LHAFLISPMCATCSIYLIPLIIPWYLVIKVLRSHILWSLFQHFSLFELNFMCWQYLTNCFPLMWTVQWHDNGKYEWFKYSHRDKMHSLVDSNIPKMSTPHHASHCCTAIQGHFWTTMCSNNVLWSLH
jgi:hypothetical protein